MCATFIFQQTLQTDKAKLSSQVQQLNKKVEEAVQKSSAPNGDLTDQGSKTKEKTILVTEHEQMWVFFYFNMPR